MSNAKSEPSNNAQVTLRTSARAFNGDFYVTALLAPRARRADLISLAAFFGEIDRIPHTTTDPMIAEIRVQWWRDWLNGLSAGQTSGNVIADQFGRTIARRGLDTSHLHKALDAKSAELCPAPFSTEQDYVDHIRNAHGGEFHLAAELLNVEPSSSNNACLQTATLAYGIMKSLQMLRINAEHGRWHLPLAWSGQTNLSEPPLEKSAVEARQSGCAVAVKRAREALAAARATSSDAPKNIIGSILPVALVGPYLTAFESALGDPLMVKVGVTPLARFSRLWWAHVTRKI